MNYTSNKVSMACIAKKLNISKNAVSLALNNKPGVSDELRQRVLDLAAELNYTTPLSSQKSNGVMVLVPEYIKNDTFFYSDIFWSIESEIKKRGYISMNASVSIEEEKNLALPSFPNDINILGILFIGIVSNDYMKMLNELDIPLVTVDISYNFTPVTSVTTSNLMGGFKATQHLIDLGHKKIGFIGPIYTAQSIYERWAGFNQAMELSNIPVNDNYNIVGTPNKFELYDTVASLENHINKISDFPTAWFCAGDRMAVALINILSKKQISVPSQISVIGFDDIDISLMVHPSLTTMRVNRKLMGKLAVHSLLQPNEEDYTTDTKIAAKLVVRNSTQAPNCNN